MSLWKFFKYWMLYDFLFGHNDDSSHDSCCNGDDDWYDRSENYGCGGSYDGTAGWNCPDFDDDMSDDFS